jgi:uncharacterized integral membrane protein
VEVVLLGHDRHNLLERFLLVHVQFLDEQHLRLPFSLAVLATRVSGVFIRMGVKTERSW